MLSNDNGNKNKAKGYKFDKYQLDDIYVIPALRPFLKPHIF